MFPKLESSWFNKVSSIKKGLLVTNEATGVLHVRVMISMEMKLWCGVNMKHEE